MNIKIVLFMCVLGIHTTYASAQNDKNQKPNEKNGVVKQLQFDLVPLNSPVKEPIAKFLIKAPTDFDIQQISYRLLSSTDLIEKNKNYSPSKLVPGSGGNELHIPMNNYPSGFYKLFVKVKIKKDQQKEYFYKSAYHDFVRFSYEKSSGEVPMPDTELNDSTVLGIDSDKNGIRDDVQIWINKTYNSSSFPNTNNALKQTHRHFQLAFENYLNKDLAVSYYNKAQEGLECIMWIRDDGYMIYKKHKAQLLNTPERIKVFTMIDSYTHGTSDHLPETSITERHQYCEFNAANE
ncbi:MAG: hypothetical protein NDI69_02455 [Bacteriovoracaceae bacterium]|nr:hypothetical protein [Bacteriovoracaceae bacterium]